MKKMPCPRNGLRPMQEFAYGGLFHPNREAAEMSDSEWSDSLFNRDGEPGIVKEWWYHAPSGTWFIAERDNVGDQVMRTYFYNSGGSHE